MVQALVLASVLGLSPPPVTPDNVAEVQAAVLEAQPRRQRSNHRIPGQLLEQLFLHLGVQDLWSLLKSPHVGAEIARAVEQINQRPQQRRFAFRGKEDDLARPTYRPAALLSDR